MATSGDKAFHQVANALVSKTFLSKRCCERLGMLAKCVLVLVE